MDYQETAWLDNIANISFTYLRISKIKRLSIVGSISGFNYLISTKTENHCMYRIGIYLLSILYT